MVMVNSKQPIRDVTAIECLRSSRYFDGLDDLALEKISRLMVERRVDKKEIIWLEEDTAKIVYFVASGLIKLFKTSIGGKEQILRLVHPGDCFGHTGVLNGGSNPESAQAIAPSLLYGFVGKDLEALLWDNRQFAVNTIKAQVMEMHQYVSLIEDLSLRYVIGRLAKMLLEHSSQGVCDTSLLLNRSDMAAMTGTVREVLWKSLKALEDNGIIGQNRQQIIIRDDKALRVMADSA